MILLYFQYAATINLLQVLIIQIYSMTCVNCVWSLILYHFLKASANMDYFRYMSNWSLLSNGYNISVTMSSWYLW